MVNIIYQKRIYGEDLLANQKYLYVFGDNVQRVGLGGQAAEARDKLNAYGIATMWAPGAPFKNEDYLRATDHIIHDIDGLVACLKAEKYKAVIFPSEGIGTGLACMEECAPSCFDFLCGYLEIKLNIKNPLLRPPRPVSYDFYMEDTNAGP